MPNVDRSTVSIRFKGEGLDPSELSKRLEFSPSEEAAKPIVKIKRENYTVWSVGYREIDSGDLGRKIGIMLNWFTNDITIWKEISGKYKGDILCGLFLDGWNRGFELSPELLKKVSDRNLFISFDLYSPTDSWDMKG